MWTKWHMSDKKTSLPSFSCSKLKGTSTKKISLSKTKNLVILYDSLMYIIINPLHTSSFSLTGIINYLF